MGIIKNIPSWKSVEKSLMFVNNLGNNDSLFEEFNYIKSFIDTKKIEEWTDEKKNTEDFLDTVVQFKLSHPLPSKCPYPIRHISHLHTYIHWSLW